jgi:hypothetical protein
LQTRAPDIWVFIRRNFHSPVLVHIFTLSLPHCVFIMADSIALLKIRLASLHSIWFTKLNLSAARCISDFGTRQLLAGILWFLFCGWVNSLSQIYVDKMHWAHFKATGSKPLPDVGFILLPRIRVPGLPDLWNAMTLLGTLLPVILFHPSRVKIVRRFAAIQGACWLLRAITIMVTILPNPYDTCENTSRADEVPFLEAFKVMFGFRITCGDVLYSGHAATFTLMALIWQEYGRSFASPKRLAMPRETASDLSVGLDHFMEVEVPKYSKEWYTGVLCPRIFWTVAVVGYLIIIACRFHYTVDVVIAIIIVVKQWGLYHMVIRTPKLIEKVPFLQWFESKDIYGPPQAELPSEAGGFDRRSVASADVRLSPTPFATTWPNSWKKELCFPPVRVCANCVISIWEFAPRHQVLQRRSALHVAHAMH